MWHESFLSKRALDPWLRKDKFEKKKKKINKIVREICDK
jgi:hypothetical protein